MWASGSHSVDSEKSEIVKVWTFYSTNHKRNRNTQSTSRTMQAYLGEIRFRLERERERLPLGLEPGLLLGPDSSGET